MIWLIIAGWYIIGAFGLFWIGYRIDTETTVEDILKCLTIGGVSGLLVWVIGLPYLIGTFKKPNWLKKRIL